MNLLNATMHPVRLWMSQAVAGRRMRSMASVFSGLALMPDVPTMSEFLPGYEASTWQAVGVPKNTPAAIIDKLNKEINAALTDPKIKARFDELGAVPLVMTPASLAKLVRELVLKRLLDGQFEECGLTLTELHKIEESLCKSLIALYHARIKYPELKNRAS